MQHNGRHKLKRDPIHPKGATQPKGVRDMFPRKILKLYDAKDAISSILGDNILRKMICLKL